MERQGDEASLIARAKAGDGEAFRRLLAPYLPMLFAYSWTLCGDYHAAQDVVQESSLIAYQNLSGLSPDFDFPAWLRAIARRKGLEMRAKLTRVKLVNPATVEAVFEEPSTADLTSRRQALSECLNALEGGMARIVQSHYFRGFRLSQIAAELRSTATAVKQILYRARLALEECVRKRLRAENS